MKAAQIRSYGGPEVVEINHDAPAPVLVAGKVLIQIHAAGVNPVDWKIRQGFFQNMIPLTFPAILGGDFSGIVLEVGDGVTSVKKGDEVYGQASVLAGGSGSFAEIAIGEAGMLAPKPSPLTSVEAAALPLAGVSAWQALMEHMHLSTGQKILIHGGAGGIGSIAIQIAKHVGATVATTVSADDVAFVKTLGADRIIDYKTERFEELAGDYDAVFDLVGGETLTRSFPVLKKGGIIVSMLDQPDPKLVERYDIRAVRQGSRVTTERLQGLTKLVEQGAVTIKVDRVFPLEEAAKALAYLEQGHPRGKVVVEVKK
jgi:NADPH:quinone reductase-like Zn-dependent oxidoreductase